MMSLEWTPAELRDNLRGLLAEVEQLADEHPDYVLIKNDLGNLTIHNAEGTYVGLIEPTWGKLTWW